MSALMTSSGLISVLVAATMASCTQAQEPSRPSILPELATMAPVIGCVDAAPADSMTDVNRCVDQAGISFGRLSREPKTIEDYKALVIASWLMWDRDPNRPLRPASFVRATDYAKCIESAAYADKSFSSRSEKGVIEAKLRAEITCKDHPLSMRGVNPQNVAATENIAERLFAKALANAATAYALEANGWYPDKMRPCIRYTDGRPPSIGCALNPDANAAPPPPLKPRSSNR